MASWQSLPTEMKLAVVDALDTRDVKTFSKLDQSTYAACVPALFRNVVLNEYTAVEQFLENVPRGYCRYIQRLELSSKTQCTVAQTEAVISLLIAAPCVEQLTLRITGSLDKSIIPCFPLLQKLTHISIANCGEEDQAPLSERLVVSIAASTPNLQHLSLDRVSRSTLHAPELVGVYPYIPLVTNDASIPAHPVLGPHLSLPSLLRIPTLRNLTIRDTHLGDAAWATTPIACKLQVLDLGACVHESPDFNTGCTERIMAAVGLTVDEFSLTTSVESPVFAKSDGTPLKQLRKLHITPFFPVDSVVDTMANLAGSPIETLSMQCYEDDVVDVCGALEEFLAMRREKGGEFYERLRRIDVTVCDHPLMMVDVSDKEERKEATRRLQRFCSELRLAGQVCVEAGSAMGRGRAMTV